MKSLSADLKVLTCLNPKFYHIVFFILINSKPVDGSKEGLKCSSCVLVALIHTAQAVDNIRFLIHMSGFIHLPSQIYSNCQIQLFLHLYIHIHIYIIQCADLIPSKEMCAL